MNDFSYITSSHPQFIEGLYQDYTKDPNSVDPEQKNFLKVLILLLAVAKMEATEQLRPQMAAPP